jgi:thymidylate synthase (FAD)
MNDAKLIALTTPVDASLGNATEFAAYCARVSNPSNQMNHETSEKLLKYLIKHSHWSPLEMVHVVMEINTTRDIARQILRHRSFSFQEFSQRYADPTSDLGLIVDREARLQDSKNRQNSIELDNPALQREWEVFQDEVRKKALKAYNWAIQNGIAKEQARAVLPEGLTVSRMYMAGTLRSWIHYCELRMANGTQKEHMLVAKSAWDELTKYFQYLTEVVATQ